MPKRNIRIQMFRPESEGGAKTPLADLSTFARDVRPNPERFKCRLCPFVLPTEASGAVVFPC